MSLVSVANQTGLHINTVSKYFKAFKEAGYNMPQDHDAQVKFVEEAVEKAKAGGMTVVEYITGKYSQNTEPVLKKSAAQTTATAAAIEESLAIVSRKLEALMQKLEVDAEETNELLGEYERRLTAAENQTSMALAIARAALDMAARQTTPEATAAAMSDQLVQIVKVFESAVTQRIFYQTAAAATVEQAQPA